MAVALLALVLLPAGRAWALTPDQIVLIVNSKVPAGQKLAEFYAQQRHLPDGRILALDLPDGDDISFDQYNQQVVPAVRSFLRDHDLEKQVTCLVTLYGVPLRIGNRPATPAVHEELHALDVQIAQTLAAARAAIVKGENLARQLSPSYHPAGGDELPMLPVRADSAVHTVLAALAKEHDPARRAAQFTQLVEVIEALAGPLETLQRLSRPPYSELAPQAPTLAQLDENQARAKKVIGELTDLGAHASEPEARARVRQLVRDNFGAFGYLSALQEQKIRLNPAETESAFDNELACLWWKDGYVRYRWQASPLYYRNRYATLASTRPASSGQMGLSAPPGAPPGPTLMVMRLDAPTEQLVHDLIVSSIEVEEHGLQGTVALDARGKPAGDPYGRYDQTIRNLAEVLRAHTRLNVVLDDREPVFPKGSVKDVALYCGWYSLRNYVPGMVFNRGAVAFHIASSELVNLHNARETGWVHGLMTDGVVGTLGPVAEPYLHSFPAADEFFPLLLTGRLTLAECYWLSNPLVSWMNTCIGDPLYNPYKVNAPLMAQDVPIRLHVVFE